MGFEQGILSGFLGRKSEYEKEQMRAAELTSAREADIYRALLGEGVNPEIQAMALAGMLESAGGPKRKGGLRGWLGEMESSPTFARLQQYLNTPQSVTEERETLPSRSLNDMRATGVPQVLPGQTVQPIVTDLPPDAGAAAQSPTSPVQPGGEPPRPLSYTQAPPQPYSMQGTALPTVFLSPEQRAANAAKAKGMATGAEFEATYQSVYKAERNLGSSHEEASDTARMAALGQAGAGRSLAPRYGGIVAGSSLPIGAKDSFGRPVVPQAFYRRETVNGVESFIPTIAPSSQIGTLRVLASPNGRPAVYRIFPDNNMEFVREVPAGVDQIPVTHADGTTEIVPVPRQFQAPSATEPTAQSPTGAVAPSTPPPAPTVAPAAQAPSKGPAGGVQTKPSTAEQKATERAATRLSTTENTQYGTPEGTTWGEIDRQGLVPMPTDVRKAVDQIDVALNQLTVMEALVKKVFGGTAPAVARNVPLVGAAMERLAQEGSLTWAMNSDDYRNLLAAKNLAIPGVARRTGEVGNLTPAEQEKAAQALPNLGEGATNTPDTLSAAVSKIAALKKQLTDQRGLFQRGNAVRRAGSGAPPPPDSAVPEELKTAPPGSVWEDDQGVPRWKKLLDGSIVPY